MNSLLARAASLACIVALAACSGMNTATPPQSNSIDAQYAQLQREIPDALPGPQSGFIPFRTANPVRALCPPTNDPNTRRCLSYVRTDLPATALTRDGFPTGKGYGPADLQAAYKLPSSTRGKGQTVAIIDAMGYPQAASDLAVYRKAAGLVACTIKNGCLKIVNENGAKSPLPPADAGWDGEQALDMDMVSAVCPNCHILLVQASSTYTRDLDAGVNTAVKLGANVVSNSYGGSEGGVDPAFAHPGHVIVASAGDNGAAEGPQDPCSQPSVVCAGGTRLLRASNARGWTETTWNTLAVFQCGPLGNESCGATGSGCSALIAKPAWQAQSICSRRAESDVSADASVDTPVAVYQGGWFGVGGTSASSPMLAAAIALAGNAGSLSQPQGIWRAAKRNFFDVVKGSNVDSSNKCPRGATKYICNARAGYDGPTGWGTPNGIGGF